MRKLVIQMLSKTKKSFANVTCYLLIRKFRHVVTLQTNDIYITDNSRCMPYW